MTKLFIYPYVTASESAKLLAERLGAKRIKLQNSEYVHDENNIVINWGNSNCPFPSLNPAGAIKNTVDKLKFFRLMMQKGCSQFLAPYWTNSQDIPDSAFPIFCRTTTTGLDGAGIVIAENRDQLVDAVLYTQFIKDTTEYRVTIFRGKVTDIQTKLPRQGENAHPMIRTFKNGWGFQRKPVLKSIEVAITKASLTALEVSGLDFGGFDVLFSEGFATVLEVNTAMGLEGEALDRFAKAVEEYIETLEVSTETLPSISTLEGPFTGNLEGILDAVRQERWTDVLKMVVGRIN